MASDVLAPFREALTLLVEAGETRLHCCVATRDLLELVHDQLHLEPSEMCMWPDNGTLLGADRVLSPMAEIEKAEVGTKVPAPEEGRWHLIQRWNTTRSDGSVDSLSDVGHQFLWYHMGGDRGVSIESSSTAGLRVSQIPAVEALGLDSVEVDSWKRLVENPLKPSGTVGIAVLHFDGDTETEESTMAGKITLPDEVENALEDAKEEGLLALGRALKDGRIDLDEFVVEATDLTAPLVDALVPTGPLDPLDDALIKQGVEFLLSEAAELVTRLSRPDTEAKLARVRRRLARAREKGLDRRVKRLEAREADLLLTLRRRAIIREATE